jgi:hypothetical protein
MFVGAAVSLTDPAAYFAMNFSIDTIETVGAINDVLSASATLSVQMNMGFGARGKVEIDFAASFPAEGDSPAGYKVNTGDPTHPIVLDYTGFLIDVSVA